MTDETGTIEELALHPGDEVKMIKGDDRAYLYITGVVNKDGNVEMNVGGYVFKFKPYYDVVSNRKWRVVSRVPRMSPEALDGPQDVAQAARVRSKAIRDFCIAAGIAGSVEAKNIPDDVRDFRMQSALRALAEQEQG